MAAFPMKPHKMALTARAPCSTTPRRRVYSTTRPRNCFASFEGLHSHGSLLTCEPRTYPFRGGSPVGIGFCVVAVEVAFPTVVSNGATVHAMRHGRKVKKLGRPADQRKALIRGLVTELLRHGKIKTTTVHIRPLPAIPLISVQPRAKAIRPFVDKMIGLAKRGDLHARRQMLGFVYDKALVKSIFDKVPERYADRNSGYTRITKEIKHRRGDNAEMSSIELV